MSKVNLILINALLLLLLPLAGHSSNQNAGFSKNKVYIVKGDQYYPPYEFINENGQPDGFNIELFKRIADDYGLKYVLQLDVWAKVREEVEEGKIDVVTGLMVSSQRAEKIVFGLPHSMMTNGLFVQKGSKIKHLSDLQNRTIAVQESDFMHDYLIQINLTPFIHATKSQQEALQLVDEGKIEAAIVGNFQGSGIIKKHQLKNVELRSSDLPSQPYAMAVSKGNEELLMILDKGLLNLKESGYYDQLYQKWFGVYEREAFYIQHQLLIIIGIVFIVLLLFFTILLNYKIRKTRLRLTKQEEKYRKLITNSKDLIVSINPQGMLTFVSPVYCKLFGKTEAELIGKDFMPLVFEEDREHSRETMQKLFEPPYHISLEQRAYTKDGLRWLLWSNTAVLNKNNEVIEIIGVGQDITEKKNAELAQKLSERRFKTLLDKANNIAVQGIEPNGIIKYWNKASERFYGYKASEALGKNVFDLIVSDDQKDILKTTFQKMVETGNATAAEEVSLMHKNGKIVNVYSNRVIIESIDKQWEVFSLDVNLDELRKAEKVQQVLFNITNALSLQNKLEDMVEFIKQELDKLMDCSNLFIAFYDEKTDLLTTLNEKDEHEDIPKWQAKGSLTGLVIEEKKSLLIDEQKFRQWHEAGKIDLIGKSSKIWLGVPLLEGEKVIGAIVVQSYDNPVAYDESSVAVLEFASKQISHVLQKQRALDELLVSKQKAEESDRLKTSFLNNLSHEIRTPLNIILGFAQIIEDEDIKEDERSKAIQNIRKGGNELTRIIENIIVTSSIETGQEKLSFESINWNNFIDGIIQEYENQLFETEIQFEHKVTHYPEPHFIKTDIRKVKHIIDHLMDNAIKFTEKGVVRLTAELTETHLNLSITDSGSGIETESQKNIFRSFYKIEKDKNKLYRGNGLGLGIVKAYVNMLKGKIEVASTIGVGSCFTCSIPIEFLDQPQQDEAHPGESILNKKLHILVVEDEPSNLLFISSILRLAGYTFTIAKNGNDAISTIENNKSINLVLMDLKLPGMNGYEASKIIKGINPSIKIIAVTAYALQGDKQKAIDSGIDSYLTKPYQKSDLITLLNQVKKHLK